MTPLKYKIQIALWRLHCAWCEVKQAFKALFGDPWADFDASRVAAR